MKIVHHVDFVCKVYHDEPAMRLRFFDEEEFQESSLYSVGEINNILAVWQMGGLKGSFATGTKLADNFSFQLVRD